jgi:hypothetical protein
MKKFIFGMTAVFAFMLVLTGCPQVTDGDDPPPDSPPDTPAAETYTSAGTSGATYSLKIANSSSRAAAGNSYELTQVSISAVTTGTTTETTIVIKISIGTVQNVIGGNITLQPGASGAPNFGVTIENNTLTGINGSITWNGGVTNNGSEDAAAAAQPESVTETALAPAADTALTVSNGPGAFTALAASTAFSQASLYDSIPVSATKAMAVAGSADKGVLVWLDSAAKNGTWNVIMRTADKKTVKYQNNVVFVNGSASVNWNTMTAMVEEQPVDPSQEIEIQGYSISQDTVLGQKGKKTYYVNNASYRINVSGNATLTILPGTTIRFTKAGGGLQISSGSALNAEGAEFLKKLDAQGNLTGENSDVSGAIRLIGGAAKGSWDRVEIASSTNNVLSYVELINGGSNASYAVLDIGNGAKADVDHCVVTGSKGYGVSVDDNAVVNMFQHNTITGCDKAPVWIDNLYVTSSPTAFDSTNSFSGNSGALGNAVEIGDYTSIESDLTVKDLGQSIDFAYTASYRSHVTGNNMPTITFNPGVAIRFTKAGGGIDIDSNATVKILGENNALSTDNKHVRFIGDSKGSWDRININSNTDNVIRYADFVNGGSNTSYAMLEIGSGAKASIDHVTVNGSGGYGISIDEKADIPVFQHNTITGCDKAPVWIDNLYVTRSATAFDDTNSFTGNTGSMGNSVEIGDYTAIGSNLTVKDLGLETDFTYSASYKFSVTGDNNPMLTVNPGVAIRFTKTGGGMVIASGATVNMTGTAEKRIVLSGNGTTKGSWERIEINSTTENQLKYVDFGYGGSNASYGMLTIGDGARAGIANCTITGSKGYGFVAYSNADISAFNNNTITLCDDAPAAIDSLVSLAKFDATSAFTGNGTSGDERDYVKITDYDTVAQNLTINKTTVPYYYAANYATNLNAKVTITPGVTFWVNNGVNLFNVVTPNGELDVTGTQEEPVTFDVPAGRSFKWGHIGIATSGCSFNWAVFKNYAANGYLSISNGVTVEQNNVTNTP